MAFFLLDIQHNYAVYSSRDVRERQAEYLGTGIRPYPGAQGNVRTPVRGTGNAGKRFWTVYLYSPLPAEDEQVGWMKEEPPSFMAGSVRRVTYYVVTCKCERS
jgi:hypothetical protein